MKKGTSPMITMVNRTADPLADLHNYDAGFMREHEPLWIRPKFGDYTQVNLRTGVLQANGIACIALTTNYFQSVRFIG
jgi:hypothetical protein